MNAVLPIKRAGKLLNFEIWEKALQSADERRRVQFLAVAVRFAERQHKPFACPGESGITIKCFPTKLMPVVGDSKTLFFEFEAIGFGKQNGCGGGRGEKCFSC